MMLLLPLFSACGAEETDRVGQGGGDLAEGSRTEIGTPGEVVAGNVDPAPGAPSPELPPPPPADMVPGWELPRPIYSREQAERGAGIFLENCSLCHPPETYTGFEFHLNWDGTTVGELYSFVSTSMPQDAPGELEPDEYAAALAFIFRQNGLPAGEEDLGTDLSELGRYRLEMP